MQARFWLVPVLLVVGCAERTPPRYFLDREAGEGSSFAYPEARRSDQVDAYHGREVADPYRWLEDSSSAATRDWIEAQNELTFAYLESLPARDDLIERLTELWNYEKHSAPLTQGGRYFSRINDGLQDQSVLHVSDSIEGKPRVLIDPNRLSEDGTVALANLQPSPSGRLLAYGLSDGGSDWREWHVLDVDSGRELRDVVYRNKFGGLEWAADESGFFYLRYERPGGDEELQAKNAPPDICFHRLGSREDDDQVVIPRPEAPGIFVGFSLTDDRQAMIVSRWEARSRNSELDFVPLEPIRNQDVIAGWTARTLEASARPVATALVKGYDAQYAFIGGDERRVWVQTNWNSPRWKIVAIDPRNPRREAWKELVGQSEQAIESSDLVGGRLIVQYLEDATSRVEVFDPSGEHLYEVDLPGLGTVSGFEGDHDDPETFFTFTSFTSPPSVYRYDVQTRESSLHFRPEVDLDAEEYETRQITYKSRDGTRIPMFLTHKKGIRLDGSNPTYLYGYGGFNVSVTPSFSVPNLVWLELGGILAIPNIRGGGEYGEEWHQAGTKLNKQNVFDDFIAAAEWLIENRYTSSEKLAIGGGSNGGLLVGACMTQRPDLFAAVLPAVGVMDMLRYHLFTIGWAWAGDYGTVEDAAEFNALLAYSPLHNLHPGTAYPATLVTTADHDDRVVPAHSFKFAATLQAAHAGPAPVLIRIETRAGHGAGKPTSMRIEEAADRWAFLMEALEID